MTCPICKRNYADLDERDWIVDLGRCSKCDHVESEVDDQLRSDDSQDDPDLNVHEDIS